MGAGGEPRRRRGAAPAARVFGPARRVQALGAHAGKVVAVAWSPSGAFLASAGQDALVKVWAVVRAGGGPVAATPIRVFQGHTADVLDMVFSAGDFLLTASVDRSVRLWHPRTAICLRNFGHSDMVTAVAFHPLDENYFLSAGCDGIVRVWRPAEHACVAQTSVGVVTAARFAPDGRSATIGTYDGTVVVLDTSGLPISDKAAATPRQAVLSVSASIPLARRVRSARPGPRVTGMAVHDVSDEVIVTSADNRVHVLRASEPTAVATRFRAHAQRPDAAVTALATTTSSDGRFMVCDARCGSVRVADLGSARRTLRARRTLKEIQCPVDSFVALEASNVSAVAFAPEAAVDVALGAGRDRLKQVCILAVGSDDGSLLLFENTYAHTP